MKGMADCLVNSVIVELQGHVASVMTRAQKRRLESNDPQEGVDDQGKGSSSGEIFPPERVRTRKASKREKTVC